MPEDPSFEVAFVTMSCLLGRRDALSSGLSRPGEEARALSDDLARASRAERAHLLARELAPLVAALDARGIR